MNFCLEIKKTQNPIDKICNSDIIFSAVVNFLV